MENIMKKEASSSNIVETVSVLPPHIFVRKERTMIIVTEQDYRLVAQRLLDEIGTLDYFNGTVECNHDEYCSTLTATLIVYRSNSAPTDIVPVWWEFHTQTDHGEEPNDFSFSTLKEYVFE